MQKIILFLFLFSSVYTSGQDNIRPTCQHNKSQWSMVKPSPEQMAQMESMAFRSDTFDIVNYSIYLDEVNYVGQSIRGHCEIDFSPKMDERKVLNLDLLNLQVDSILFMEEAVSFTYDSLMIHIFFNDFLDQADTFKIDIYYGGHPTIDASGFGGFDFQDGYAYNLGIGLASIPHNYGRGWFPCFDNFVERSTFDFYVTTHSSQTAYCVGTLISEQEVENNKKLFHYSMKQPITTYQAAVAIADYSIVQSFHEGMEKEIPIELVAKEQDTSKFKNSFAFLTDAIEALEKWYGPYQWERVGYVITTRGAMEHPTCVAYPSNLGLNENKFNNMDIMSHELAHHWFGNLTTLTTAYDMWIKEGTSEYGYHLFAKELLGDEEFVDLIADNQFDVIENAHRADDGFRALSGMPFEYTYGTTTYQKGAAVIHNMHSYLGDSLFKIGVRAILDKYAFSHCDAAEFESTLSETTGIDMTSFFNDWIYAPGFSAFEIDSSIITEDQGNFNVELFIEQKLFHVPHYHNKVPMILTIYDKDWQRHSERIELDGQYSSVTFDLDFEPLLMILNENSFLNNAQLSYTQVITENDKYEFNRSKVDIKVENIKDSLFLAVEHIWGAPDPILNQEVDVDLSDNHYWNIKGINEGNALMTTKFYYEGNHADKLDFDLCGESEEDIILLYRKNASMDWVEYPYAKKNSFIPTDGKGFFIVDSLLFGQYTFANGTFNPVNTDNLRADDTIAKIYPNPASGTILIETEIPNDLHAVEIINMMGQKIGDYIVNSNNFSIDIHNFLPGTYFINFYDEAHELIGKEKLIKL